MKIPDDIGEITFKASCFEIGLRPEAIPMVWEHTPQSIKRAWRDAGIAAFTLGYEAREKEARDDAFPCEGYVG